MNNVKKSVKVLYENKASDTAGGSNRLMRYPETTRLLQQVLRNLRLGEEYLLNSSYLTFFIQKIQILLGHAMDSSAKGDQRQVVEMCRSCAIVLRSIEESKRNIPDSTKGDIHKVWKSLFDEVLFFPDKVKSLSCLDIVTFLKSLNEYNAADPKLKDALVVTLANRLLEMHRSEDAVSSLSHTIIKSLVRSFALWTERDPSRVDEIVELVSVLSEVACTKKALQCSDLSAVIWGLTVLGERRVSIYTDLQHMVVSQPKEYTSIEMFHIMWSYSTACKYGEVTSEFCMFVLNAFKKDMLNLSIQRLATAVRALSHGCTQRKTPEFVFECAGIIEKIITEKFDISSPLSFTQFAIKDVAQVSVGATKVGQCCGPVGLTPPAACAEFAYNLKDFFLFHTANGKANDSFRDSYFRSMLWCIAWYKKDTRPERQLFLAAIARISHNEVLSIEDISTMIWSLARLCIRDITLDFLKWISKKTLENIDKLSPSTLTSILYSIPKLGGWCDTLGSKLGPKIAEMFGVCNSIEMSSILWAYAIAGQIVPEVLTTATKDLATRQRSVSDFGPKYHLNEKDEWICKWSLCILLDEVPEVLKPFNAILRGSNKKLEKKGYTATCELAPMMSSEVHADVSKRLAYLKIVHENEYIIDGVIVDIAIPECKLAIEVEGPHHYILFSDGSKRLEGPALWKKRRVEKAGWNVEYLNTKEFEANSDRIRFIQNIVNPYITKKESK